MMDIEALVNLLVNNGVQIGVIVYFMWYNKEYADNVMKAVQSLTEAVNKLTMMIEMKEDKE